MLTVCPQCDLVQNVGELSPGDRASCFRCHAELASGFGKHLNSALGALATAAILLVIMNAFPLVEMHVQGSTRVTTLLGAVRELSDLGRAPLAFLVLITTVFCPIAEVGLLALVLVPLRLHYFDDPGSHLVGLLHRIRPWSMVEVFMLGVLVALVKLAALAEIVLGPALWACAGLIVTMSLLRLLVRAEDLWAWSRGATA